LAQDSACDRGYQCEGITQSDNGERGEGDCAEEEEDGEARGGGLKLGEGFAEGEADGGGE
jgi:hypothetical protein